MLKSRIPKSVHIVQNNVLGIENNGKFESKKVQDVERDDRWETQIFPALQPVDRQQVLYLKNAMKKLLNNKNKRNEMEQADFEWKIYDICLHEIVRQVYTHCTERGELLLSIQKNMNRVFQKMVPYAKDGIEKVEAVEKENRILQTAILELKDEYETKLVYDRQVAAFQRKVQISDIHGEKQHDKHEVQGLDVFSDMQASSLDTIVLTYRKQVESVVKIQQHFRTKRLLQMGRDSRRRMRRNLAALKIQKSFRSYLMRFRHWTYSLNAQMKKKQQTRLNAILLLQKCIRNRKKRCDAVAKKAELQLEAFCTMKDLSQASLQTKKIVKKGSKVKKLVKRKSTIKHDSNNDSTLNVVCQIQNSIQSMLQNPFENDQVQVKNYSDTPTALKILMASVEALQQKMQGMTQQLLLAELLPATSVSMPHRPSIRKSTDFRKPSENRTLNEVSKELRSSFRSSRGDSIRSYGKNSMISNTAQSKRDIMAAVSEIDNKSEQTTIITDPKFNSSFRRQTTQSSLEEISPLATANFRPRASIAQVADKLLPTAQNNHQLAALRRRVAKNLVWTKHEISEILKNICHYWQECTFLALKNKKLGKLEANLQIKLVCTIPEWKELIGPRKNKYDILRPNLSKEIKKYYQNQFGIKSRAEQGIQDLAVSMEAHQSASKDVALFSEFVAMHEDLDEFMLYIYCRSRAMQCGAFIAGKGPTEEEYVDFAGVQKIGQELFRIKEENYIVSANPALFQGVLERFTPKHLYEQFLRRLSYGNTNSHEKPVDEIPKKLAHASAGVTYLSMTTSLQRNTPTNYSLNGPSKIEFSIFYLTTRQFYLDHLEVAARNVWCLNIFQVADKDADGWILEDEFVNVMSTAIIPSPKKRELLLLFANTVANSKKQTMSSTQFIQTVYVMEQNGLIKQKFWPKES